MRRPLLILACTIVPLSAADELGDGKKKDGILPPEAALKAFTVAPGLRVDLWASEPLFENPVAFAFDQTGRAYVAETNRRRSSTPDIRRNESWVSAMLGMRTVEDRVAFLKKELAPELKLKPSATRPDLNGDGQFDWRDLTVESERIRVVEDSDGDGRADKSRVLAEGFNSLATGTAAGVMPLPNGDVLYTCIPDLWLIKPDGSKKPLSTGYGVHVAYSGHDMHGLRMGPDGRVYFSIADTGASVAGPDGKRIENADCGGVFRCWPDGTGLELFAKGLRNPQDLAFNEFGDLFTGDNNADGGDKARIIHVVEGADYGWRIGWQFLPKLGAWNSEGMWHLDVAETNAAILPPVAHVGHGPAGFSFYPGTGLPEKYRGHFFMADFPGGVRDFAVKQKGASYELADFAPDAPVLQNNQANEMTGKVLWNLYPSDVQFPPGGGVMVLDWVQGWEKTGKGRIFRVHAPELEKDALIAETKRLLGEGMAKRPAEELATLLGHADQRVRMAAQFELSAKGEGATLEKVASDTKAPQLARLHALWGMGKLALSKEHLPAAPILACVHDADAEVRAQAAHVLVNFLPKGEDSAAVAKSEPFIALVKALDDPAPRVRFFALQSLANSRSREAASALMRHLSAESSGDAYLHHALSRALVNCVGAKAEYLADILPSSAKEEMIIVALEAARFTKAPGLDSYLYPSRLRLQLEAARAIHDEPIPASMPGLAALLNDGTTLSLGAEKSGDKHAEMEVTAISRRAVNAAYRVGNLESAQLLAGTAANAKFSEAVRLDALDALLHWPEAPGRDRVLGIVMTGNGPRKREDAAAALAPALGSLLAEKSAALCSAALDAAAANGASSPAIATLEADLKAPSSVRVAALRALDKLKAPELPAALQAALADKDKAVLEAARRIQVNRTPGDALAQVSAVLKKGSIPDQQEAIETLGNLDQKGTDELLTGLLFKMKTGKLPAALHLDVLEAAAKRSDPTVVTMIKEWDKLRKKDDALAAWSECLEGGDAKAGREIFAEKAEVACLRCHAVAKQGGDVGPDLAGVATKHDRRYLLRSVVDPNAEIAPGYENMLVTLNDGNVLAGIATGEDAETLTLKNVADGKPQVVKKSAIKDRQKLPTAMPPGLGDALGKHALRDLVEYLGTLK